jgi:3'-phosphoadenosine 5'-phosphosulfate sulfotransferase (PAPS reductase)/FAD synthetase
LNNPYLITEPTVISFSGGRTSAYMLWKVLEAHNNELPPEAIVCFANTGKEEEATLKFVNYCSVNWNVDIVWLEFRDNEKKFAVVDYETASRNGEPFESLIKKRKFLPNPTARFCTVELKVRTIHRYLKSIGIESAINMIGIRADEQRRLAKVANNDYGKQWEKSAPLGIDGVTKYTVSEFWKKQPFDLELFNNNGVTMHGNCDLCFLKGGNQVQSLIEEKPERALWWAKMETLVQTSNLSFGDGGRFRKDRPSYQQMYENTFNQKSMEFFDESIECFCGE